MTRPKIVVHRVVPSPPVAAEWLAFNGGQSVRTGPDVVGATVSHAMDIRKDAELVHGWIVAYPEVAGLAETHVGVRTTWERIVSVVVACVQGKRHSQLPEVGHANHAAAVVPNPRKYGEEDGGD